MAIWIALIRAHHRSFTIAEKHYMSVVVHTCMAVTKIRNSIQIVQTLNSNSVKDQMLSGLIQRCNNAVTESLIAKLPEKQN